MYTMMDALKAGNIGAARKMALTFEELEALSARKVVRKEYEERLESFLKGVSRELLGAVEMDKAVCADVLILPKSGKIRREVTMAVIHATFRVKGQPAQGKPMPFLFVNHEGRWKLFLRK
jgi:hypothetical protein